ncbi:MAG TPA: tryptophan synthase subunit alpha [Firmicutes bacterium]|nr:tryptophan synthase subunit alpha [Bacillota bacterium]
MSEKRIQFMAHLVAGYPDLLTTEIMMKGIENAGADSIELQIPFSDPLADGPLISSANHQALRNAITLKEIFRLLDRIAPSLPIPVFLMTYSNIVFQCGSSRFCSYCKKAGIKHLIVPDLPFDSKHALPLDLLQSFHIDLVPVLSPSMSRQRLDAILSSHPRYVYTTLKTGITGPEEEIQNQGFRFLKEIREKGDFRIIAGFGLQSPSQIHFLKGYADIAVVGSHLLRLYNESGSDAVFDFIRTYADV